MNELYKILIVDDEFFIRDGLMSYQWQELGFTAVNSASDGQEALQLMNNDPADIIIADIKMPIMNGLELCEKIQEDYPMCRVILLTGHKSFDYAKEAIKHGVFDYLLKPVNHNSLRDVFIKLKETLDKERNRQTKDDPIIGRLKNNTSSPIVKKTIDYIKNHYHEKISLKKTSEAVYLNPSYLSTLFKEETGKNFIDFVTEYRIYKAKELLQQIDLKIYQIADMIGYSSPKYFMDIFKKKTGLTPGEYRQKQVD